jgi:dTDP-4-amino-4,6-dideoxygalactose transaminase
MDSSGARTAPAASAPAGVPLLDVARHHGPILPDLEAALIRVLRSGRYVFGPECEELERRLAEYCGAPHAVACASGSDALLLALMALDVGPGDEVIVPSYTFFATASAVWRLGAKPVFVDIEPEHYTLDPVKTLALVGPKTKAVIPVHLYGQCADMQALAPLAARGVTVIEDAAQSIGAEFQGRRCGALGPMGCFSFYPTKNLGGLGDGGLLTAATSELAERLRLLRGHGMHPRYYHREVGINSRLDTLQAAALCVKLDHLEHWTAQRAQNAQHYTELFTEFGLDRVLGLPRQAAGRRHVWNQYIVRVPEGKRDTLRQYLADAKIGTEIYYPVPLHRQDCFRSLGYKTGDLPESERAAAETLALPIFPGLTQAEQHAVVTRIADFYGLAQRFGSSVPRPKFLDRTTSPAAHGKLA